MIQWEIDILNGNLEIGRKYKIIRTEKCKELLPEFTGILKKKYKNYILIQNNTRCECFLKIDFILGDYMIEEAN